MPPPAYPTVVVGFGALFDCRRFILTSRLRSCSSPMGWDRTHIDNDNPATSEIYLYTKEAFTQHPIIQTNTLAVEDDQDVRVPKTASVHVSL